MTRLLAVLLWSVSVASGYYHYVHYSSRTGPYVPIREKYDLTALVNKTLPFFVADLGPTQYGQGDNFAALVSQIRGAARVWSDVDSSDLRISYGGLYSQGTTENSPGIDVVFSDDLPPGLVAYTVNTTKANADLSAPFLPITRSTIMFPKDVTSRPSYTEAFFLTAVHEFGHALGLQHTLTSSALSTEVTRGTSKSRPLTPDDVAGISVLYPSKNFVASTGVVSGRVVMEGSGVSLASVVLLTPSGPVISGLTHPDGTYRIEGVPTGQYYLYVHPLPPALPPGETTPANIIAPRGPDNQPLPFGASFDLLFYPGTKDVQQAFPISVTAGSSQDNLNFTVTRRARQTLYAVQTFGFPGDTPVKPPFLSVDIARPYIVAAGYGLVSNGAPSPGLKASVIGGAASIANDGIQSYPYSSAYIEMGVQFSPLAGDGPRHLIFSLNGENYVLPTAFRVVQKAPPSVQSITPSSDANGLRIATLSGTGFQIGTRFLFDGETVTIRSVDEAGQKAVVLVPPAAPGTKSIVTAYNPDGQSSLFLQNNTPPVYTYDNGSAASFVLTPSALAAGTRTIVQVDGINTNFVDGQVTVGFGSSDVTVERVWVVSPTQLLANVVVSANAPAGLSLASITNGLQILSQPFGFQVQAARATVQVSGPVVNGATGLPSLTPGSVAAVVLANSTNASIPVVTLNDKLVTVVSSSPGQLSFLIPSSQPVGAAVLKISVGSEVAQPLVVNIDTPPPTVITVTTSLSAVVDQSRPAKPGDTLIVNLTGLPDNVAGAQVVVVVDGIEHYGQLIGPQQVQFVLLPLVTGGSPTLTVVVDGRSSNPYSLPTRVP